MENSEILFGLAGVLLSLFFSYVPKFKDWYNLKDSQTKQLVMLGLLALVTLATGALSCANVVTSVLPVYTCDQAGIVSLVEAFFYAVVGNVVAYQSTNYIKQ